MTRLKRKKYTRPARKTPGVFESPSDGPAVPTVTREQLVDAMARAAFGANQLHADMKRRNRIGWARCKNLVLS